MRLIVLTTSGVVRGSLGCLFRQKCDVVKIKVVFLADCGNFRTSIFITTRFPSSGWLLRKYLTLSISSFVKFLSSSRVGYGRRRKRMSHDFRCSFHSRSTLIVVLVFLFICSSGFRAVLKIRFIARLASFLLSSRLSGIIFFWVMQLWAESLFSFFFIFLSVYTINLSVHVAFNHEVILATVEPEHLLRNFNNYD